MQSIKMRSRVGNDGILHLDVPLEIRDAEIEVTVTVKSVDSSSQKGWMSGFFEEVVGGWVGEPLTRAEQGEFETREPLFDLPA